MLQKRDAARRTRSAGAAVVGLHAYRSGGYRRAEHAADAAWRAPSYSQPRQRVSAFKIDDPARYQSPQRSNLRPRVQAVRAPARADYNYLAGVAFLTPPSRAGSWDDLADEWFVSRATLQNDMADVREHAQVIIRR